MINGVINVYKEPGFTSHDVVAKLRGILKQKKSILILKWKQMIQKQRLNLKTKIYHLVKI